MREAAPLRPAGILRRAAVAALAAAAVAAGSPAVAAGDGAPAGEVLSLERAIDLALAGNRQLRAAGAGVDAAVAGGDEARAESRPRLDLAAVYQRTDNPVLVFGNLLGQERFGAGNFAVDRLNRPAPLDNWKTRLSVRQPLWTAGRIRHGVAAAEGLARAAADEHEALRQQIAERTIAAYAAAVLAGHELELSRQALLTAEEHLRLVRNLHEGGLVVESDVLQAEVRVSEVRELVIRAETGLEIRRGELNLILGRAPETPVRLAETLPAEEAAEDQESDLASLVAAARAARADLRAARERRAAAQQRVALARAQGRPRLALEGAVEANADSFAGRDGDNWAVTVALEVPLFDGFKRRARLRRAAAEARRADELAAHLDDAVALEVRRAAAELAAARARLAQGERAVALAERSLAIVRDRYREGLTVLSELLDAENALTRARLRRLAARRDLLLGRAALKLATGRLLPPAAGAPTPETPPPAEVQR